MNMPDIHGIQPGWEVWDAKGEKVGDVVSLESNCVHVKTGGLFSKDYYIPPSAIDDIEEHRVELSVAKTDVVNQGWDKRPTETVSSGTGGNAPGNDG
jgi:hypothetical protein